MNAVLAAEKRAVRDAVRARLRALPRHELERGGAAAAAFVVRWLIEHATPGPVALFAARPFELATHALDVGVRAAGRARLLPAIEGDHLVFRAVPNDVDARDLPVDHLGIPTPPPSAPAVPLVAAALVVVPACAVDLRGGRLGFGRGFYDRALLPRCAHGRARGTIALVHDTQLVDAVPRGPTDVLVERICTPARGLLEVPGTTP